MSNAGYYRFPTIYRDTVVFVSEDDLWTVPLAGGVARRLTNNRGSVTYPLLSPDGTQIAFVGREEGAPDIYLMPAEGGSQRRLTYLASPMRIVGWNAAGTHIQFASSYGQMINREMGLFQVAADARNGQIEALPYGLARSLSVSTQGGVVLGRNTNDPAHQKRYRGGKAGRLWIDKDGNGEFVRFLTDLDGNITSPMWLRLHEQERIYFVSDHEGVGNLYSCTSDETDLRRHTDHTDYYVRHPSTDGRHIVYHAGADLFVHTPADDSGHQIEVAYHSPRVQRDRKFVAAGRYVDSAVLHPSGQALAVNTRGKAFTFFNFDGPVLQLGKRDGVRYRLADWLNDGYRLVMISDDPGEEVLEIHDTQPGRASERLDNLDIGRAVSLRVSPTEDKVAIANHRHELLVVDLAERTVIQVDRSPYRRIAGFDWAPDGKWLAYGYAGTSQTTEIRLFRVGEAAQDEGDGAQENPVRVTRPVLHDGQPAFDPAGRYLYFLSEREFNPVYDGLHFDLGFPWGMRPYLITLQADLPNPFVPHPERSAGNDGGGDDGEDADIAEQPEAEVDDEEDVDNQPGGDPDERTLNLSASKSTSRRAVHQAQARNSAQNTEPASSANNQLIEDDASAGDGPEHDQDAPAEDVSGASGPSIRVDMEGIEERIFAFPVQDARYGQIMGVKNKAVFTEFPIIGMLDGSDYADDDDLGEDGALRAYDFKEYKHETLVENVRWIDLSRDRSKLLYGASGRLRVIDAGEKPSADGGHPRKSGWIDLGRAKVSIDPQREWEQMYREAWRLQRDHFWTEDMSQVDWQEIYHRYFPLIARVSSRSEFSDLMWEMQGELGTSHAYEYGGDYRSRPYYPQGYLGATLAWDEEADGYRIDEIVQGDAWDRKATSPLGESALDIRVGDVVKAVNGQPLDRSVGPGQLLVNLAEEEVLLTLAVRETDANAVDEEEDEDVEPTRSIVVRTLGSEARARYRAWVEANRQRVHDGSSGRVGYVHIPDMGPSGYAEFHRGYLAEIDRDGLIVDVRYNGGGHVSQLILEKLARRRLGYDISRWGGMTPYPLESVAGPLVAVTNEHAASDGDAFCHSFKLMGLGPLIGQRTWGGVIGIHPRHPLVDGTITTQPEFSLWFEDVGWRVENYGTDPDIEIEISPQDYAAGRDPQLERAIEESLRLLEETPILRPDLSTRPNLSLPALPKRRNE